MASAPDRMMGAGLGWRFAQAMLSLPAAVAEAWTAFCMLATVLGYCSLALFQLALALVYRAIFRAGAWRARCGGSPPDGI